MIRLGVERLSAYGALLHGKRLGMIVSAASVDRQLQSDIDYVQRYGHLCVLYGPEHGVRGAADAGEDVDGAAIDPVTGLKVYSLYRKDGRHLLPEMVQDVDVLLYDVQDLGLRFYTFVSTLLNTLEDCASFGKELIVLDRPNPLGGLRVEGGMLQDACKSFIGSYPMPVRYGLTPGEFAQMANTERHIGCQLTVIPMEGWKREQLFPALGYPFMMPSPAIPRFDNALLYAGNCIFEGVNLSEGRGTADPFALIGAPFLDAEALCARMRALHLPGVLFTPATFKPTASKHRGVMCGGVHFHLVDAQAYRPLETAVRLLDTVRSMAPEQLEMIQFEESGKYTLDLLTGSSALREGEDIEQLLQTWAQESQAFTARKKKYELYESDKK